MKILVCLCQSPDTTSKISFKDNNTTFNKEGVQFIINPYDEFALTRALEIKESQGGSVTIITVGLSDIEPVIRKGLAIGADDAIRINYEPTDAYFVASQIANVAKDGGYEMILGGKETIDYNGSQVMMMIGELLDLPVVSVATKLDLNGNIATLEREIEGGKEVVTVNLPFVASAQKGMSEPRIPNMRGIMSARTKPLKVIDPTNSDFRTQTKGYDLPPAKAGCKFIEASNMDELVNLLHNEAKVI